MDLKWFFGVLRRHKLMMIGGTVLAAVVAVLAYTKLAPEVWQSQSQLLIAQGHDPYGAAAQPVSPNGGNGVSYMASLAPIYAALANGDVIQGEIRKVDPGAKVVATGLSDPATGASLPMVQLMVAGSTPAGAHKLAALAATTLENYVASEQAASDVPQAQRVQFSFIQDGAQTKLLSGPSKFTSLLLFVVVLGCVLGLAFKLDKPSKSSDDEFWAGHSVIEAEDAHTAAPNGIGAASAGST
jgi:hypothetical protein